MTKKFIEGLREEMDELLTKAYEEGRAKGIADSKRVVIRDSMKVVDRFAEVGETIVIVDRYNEEERYENGETFKVEYTYGDGDVNIRVNGKNSLVLHSEYNVVVEAAPTPEIETIERDVKVGDKILIVNRFATEDRYSNGDVLEVVCNYESDGDVDVLLPSGEAAYVLGSEYEVVKDEEVSADKLLRIKTEDKAAKVGDKVLVVNSDHANGLYENGDILEVKRVRHTGGVGASTKRGREVYLYRSEYEVVLEDGVGTSNQHRASMIKCAKEYVKSLEGVGGVIRLDAVNFMGREAEKWGNSGMMATCRAEYVVDADKRTVVALLKGEHTGDLYAKGIAKCSPGDVFNADIGKAIALPRALSKDVPSEFTDVIQPEGVVVGMEVKTYYTGGGVNDTCPTTVTGIYRNKFPKFSNGSYSSKFSITDDTNADYTKS